MRVEEKLLSIREIVICMSIFDQCGLQNDVGVRKESVQESHHKVVSTY